MAISGKPRGRHRRAMYEHPRACVQHGPGALESHHTDESEHAVHARRAGRSGCTRRRRPPRSAVFSPGSRVAARGVTTRLYEARARKSMDGLEARARRQGHARPSAPAGGGRSFMGPSKYRVAGVAEMP